MLRLAAAFALAAGPAFAGAWTQQPGGGLLIISAEQYSADAGYDFAGNPDPDARYRRRDAAVWGEYGALDWLTLGGEARIREAAYLAANSGDRIGFSRVSGFARARLAQSPRFVAAAQVGAGAPLSDGRPRISDEGPDLEARGLLGYSATTRFGRSFLNLEAGYRARLGASADEIRLEATLGLTIDGGPLVLLQGFSTLGLRDSGLGGDDYDVHKLQVSAVSEISPRVSLQSGYMREIAGRNIRLGESLFAAIWIRF